MENILQQVSTDLYDGKADRVASLVQEALDEGLQPSHILSRGLLAGMDQVGRDFKAGKMYVPGVLVAARAMHAGMAVLRPLLVGDDVYSAGKCVIGTVEGDLHDIGKNLVKMMLEGAGFEVVDLGVDVSPGRFIDALREHKPDVLCMSALLTTTMKQMRLTIELLDEAGVRDGVQVMVGGAPVTSDFAGKIGADGYAPDAASAAEQARALVSGRGDTG